MDAVAVLLYKRVTFGVAQVLAHHLLHKDFRPAEVDTLLGNPSKAKAKLGWTAKTSFDTLVEEMTHADLREAERDALVKKHGHRVHNQHE